MTSKPYQARGRKPSKRSNPLFYPQNKMIRCTDCGAGFREMTDATEFDMHCLRMGAGTSHGGRYGQHHGWIGGNWRNSGQIFRRISDATDDFNAWLAQDAEDR